MSYIKNKILDILELSCELHYDFEKVSEVSGLPVEDVILINREYGDIFDDELTTA